MPKLSVIRLPCLVDLAEQVRFAPSARTIEQLGRVIQLAREIEPDGLYPEDWLILRITGYRPDVTAPAMIVGAALLRDLSAFAERLSDRAELAPGAVPDGKDDSLADDGRDAHPTTTNKDRRGLSLEELCTRWSVSARTIERHRRQGLIAIRVKDGGRTRLEFPRLVVESFERTNQAAVRQAAKVRRLNPEERSRLIRIALRAHRRFGWSMNRIAAQLAEREGRSHEGVRQALRRAGLIEPPHARRRRAVMRARQMGVSEQALAVSLGKTVATVRRIVNEERLAAACEDLISVGVGAWPALLPDRVIAEALQTREARTRLAGHAEVLAGEFVESARSTPAPDRVAERAMAMALRALLSRAFRQAGWCSAGDGDGRDDRPAGRVSAVRAASRHALSPGALDSLETDLRWASRLAEKLVRSQRGFILTAIESRLQRPFLEHSADMVRAVHCVAFDAAIASVWRFDPAKSGRLAARVGLTLERSLGAWLRTHGEATPASGARAKAGGVHLDDWTVRVAPWQRRLGPRARVSARLDEIDEHARRAIELHFGLLDEPPYTIAEVAVRLAISSREVGRFIRGDAAVRAAPPPGR